ncbi:hypothetical protein SAMN04488574_12123 [Bacillus sp. 71mf]|nr:hypothetical protein SAMN04488574_12123 [Bacillus sp. 71mf]SFT14171.1 hypothetical protein SAMN04488145_11376 [Bacillus sp. 103mf]
MNAANFLEGITVMVKLAKPKKEEIESFCEKL